MKKKDIKNLWISAGIVIIALCVILRKDPITLIFSFVNDFGKELGVAGVLALVIIFQIQGMYRKMEEKEDQTHVP